MMQVNYLGPPVCGVKHPALAGYDLDRFPTSCYAVELGDGVGVDGPLIEGDVLIVDSARWPTHYDLTVAFIEGERGLYRVWRIGGHLRLVSPVGQASQMAKEEMLRGVVVSQARQYVV